MQAKKILFLFIFPVITQVVVSCCDCPETETKHYSNKSLAVQNLDNTGSQPIVLSAGTVLKSAYGIRVKLSREKLAYNAPRPSIFLSSAYAYDCFCPPPRQYLPKDSVTGFQIFTLVDFDASHSANADVSGYFKVYQQYSLTAIPKYLAQSSLIVYDEADLEVQLDLMLMKAPSMNTKHKFNIRITLSDGRVLEQETPETNLI